MMFLSNFHQVTYTTSETPCISYAASPATHQNLSCHATDA